ncbi:MAG: 30S ribosomal protein S27ae [Methanobacteriota archaeon]|nr:MAG: 30S ribosomal protein S27ae [Euryarchaeota archaeon]
MAAEKSKETKKLRKAKKDCFSIEDGSIKRTKKHCPKCGPGVFMAAHKDRTSCGKCGYTEFLKGK